MNQSPAIGIDLGTTNSCVAVMRNGIIEIIPNEQGSHVTPSYVAFNDNEVHVGAVAKRGMDFNAKNTVFDIKRLMGRKFNDPSVQNDMKHWPYLIKNVDSDPYVEVMYKGEQKLYAPEQISGMVLAKLKEIAEHHLDEKVHDAVITVPAYFNNAQRQATIDAGQIAGLNVLKIINEPTAAALAFGYINHESWDKSTNILVYDLGGGTFDVSILNFQSENVLVCASNGDTHLGGEDFDCLLVDYCLAEFRKMHVDIDLRNDKTAMRRLRAACEEAKRDLSTTTNAKVSCIALQNSIDFQLNISRECFERINAPFFRKTLDPIQRALRDAKMTNKDIDVIVLVGGSTRIPKIQRTIQDFFGGKALNKSINPEEAVAYGAALSAAIIRGNRSAKIFGTLLTDITPLSLGYGENVDFRAMCVVIPRNSPIPTRVRKVCTTIEDNQDAIEFHIRQGESANAMENHMLGQFVLSGFPMAPAGALNVEVVFDLNANGMLKVTAQEQDTGTSNAIQIRDISTRSRLKRIREMVKEAQEERAENEKRIKRMRAREGLELACHMMKGAIEQDEEEEDDRNQMALKESVMRKCNEIISWLNRHLNEKEETYEKRHIELKKLAKNLKINF